jgi:DNA polymerase I
MQFNEQLYGKDPTERIVAIQLITPDPEAYIRVYIRENDGIRHEDVRFYPFFYVSDVKLLTGFPTDKFKYKPLKGSGFYRYLVWFDSWKEMWKARKHIAKATKCNDGNPRDIFIVKNPEQQYLMQSGRTLFKGMDHDQIHRLNLDIEAMSPTGFPNANRKEHEIAIVSLKDNRGYEEVLFVTPKLDVGERKKIWREFPSEPELLKYLVDTIKRRDPDVFVGHNIYAFDLPYIHERCKRYNIKFDLGRDQSEPQVWQSRIKFAERDIEYPAYEFAGRHVIDTLFLVMAYDVVKRNMPGYKLKVAAQHFGFAPEDRTYIEGDKIYQTWQEDPRKLLDYALDDVIETAALEAHLGGAIFFSTQMIPMPYSRVARAGTATKIESLMVRNYLAAKYSLPHYDTGAPEVAEYTDERKMEVGGYTDIFKIGRHEDIKYIDVSSLYPSIMIHFNVEPFGDDLKAFQGLLRQLTELRLSTKAEAKRWEKLVKEYEDKLKLLGETKDPIFFATRNEIEKLLKEAKRQHAKFDNMQAAYKILINSFFGAMGSGFFVFNDYKEADRVTITGQKLLNMIIRFVREDGGTVIEVDTDGVLAMPPPFVYRKDLFDAGKINLDDYRTDREPMDDESWTKSITDKMPEGILIDFDGRAEVMISFKKKNYVLKEPGKEPKLKGGSLISRQVEPYRREFVKEVMYALIDNDVARIHDIYKRYWLKIVGHDWTPAEFAKTQTLKDSLEVYDKKVELGHGNGGRHRSAPYELAKQLEEQTGNKAFVGDRIGYYVAGDKKRHKTRAFEQAKLVDDWNPNEPDEHTEWYLHKLKESANKFKVFFTPKDFKLLFSETDEEDVDYQAIKIQNKDVIRKPLRVIIAGTRDIESMFWIERAIAGCKFLKEISGDIHPKGFKIGEVVCGMAPGADSLGYEWAKENGIPVAEFPADWDNLDVPNAVIRTRKDGKKYNAIAGHMRNEKMAEYAHAEGDGALIAIWDGQSRGTRDMIDRAKKLKMKVYVSKIKPYAERNPK